MPGGARPGLRRLLPQSRFADGMVLNTDMMWRRVLTTGRSVTRILKDMRWPFG